MILGSPEAKKETQKANNQEKMWKGKHLNQGGG